MSELVKYDAVSGDVITPLNETTPNLGLNKPTVGGDDNVWGGLLNDNSDVLDTTITDLRGEIATLVGVLLFIGSYDAPADHAYFTGASGFPDGPLPPASASNFNVYLIVTVGGMGTGNAPAVQLIQGDWLVSDGIQWNRLALGIPPGGDVAAANVTVTPAVQGATDVQAALEQLESNYLPLTGGVLGGSLRTLGGTSAAPGLLIGGTDAGFWRLGNTVFLNAGSASPAMGWFATGITAYVPITLSADPTAALGAATKQYIDATPALHNVGRNLLHNPLFNVAQRGAGPFTANVYTLDRWRLFANLDTASVVQQALVPASLPDEAAAFALGNTFTGDAGAAAQTVVYQFIEDVRRLSAKTVTVSFFAAATSGTPRIGVSIDQNFGTGGSPSATAFGTGQSTAISTTWTRYSLTFTVPSISGKTLGSDGDHSTSLNIWYSSGATNATRAGNVGVQSGTMYVWGVQLEIGTQPTPLEKPDPRYDLANCQRFYVSLGRAFNVGFQSWGAGAACAFPVCFPVDLRATPTIVLGGSSGLTNISTITATGIDTLGLTISFAATAAGATGGTVTGLNASADF
jgi:hypothetical protein